MRGVHAPDRIVPVARAMQAIGYERALVVHGFDANCVRGMDEVSILGQTEGVELSADGRLEPFTLSPEDAGFGRASYREIAAARDLRAEAHRFRRVLAGDGHPACVAFPVLNAGAILYVAGRAESIRAGTQRARELVHTGRAARKLSAWSRVQA